MSFLTKCPICGGDVDYDAIMCPHCGASRSSRKNSFGMGAAIPAQAGAIGIIVIVALIEMVYKTFPETFNHINRVENVWCGYLSEKSSNTVIRIYKKDVDKKGSSICLKNTSLRGEEYFKLRQKSRTRLDDEPFWAGKYKEKIVVIKGKPYEDKNSDKNGRYKILVENITEWDGTKKPAY